METQSISHGNLPILNQKEQVFPFAMRKSVSAVTLDPNDWVLKKTLYVSAVDKRSSMCPQDFALRQNFPNPFNPTTTIAYALPHSGIVSINICDVLGRRVATLIDEFKPAGNYTAQFNAEGLSSGIYFCRMHAGNYVETKKLILAR